MMEKGYYSGGTITTGTKKIEELEKRVEELEKKNENLKTSSIGANSILMDSNNSDLNIGSYNLSRFSNKFYTNFNVYFTYNSGTGELTCKQDGWYAMKMSLNMNSNDATNWSNTSFNFSINGVTISSLVGYCSSYTAESTNGDTSSVYLKEGDIVRFTKTTSNCELKGRNVVQITIIKI